MLAPLAGHPHRQQCEALDGHGGWERRERYPPAAVPVVVSMLPPRFATRTEAAGGGHDTAVGSTRPIHPSARAVGRSWIAVKPGGTRGTRRAVEHKAMSDTEQQLAARVRDGARARGCIRLITGIRGRPVSAPSGRAWRRKENPAPPSAHGPGAAVVTRCRRRSAGNRGRVAGPRCGGARPRTGDGPGVRPLIQTVLSAAAPHQLGSATAGSST